jgi:predicted kinase
MADVWIMSGIPGAGKTTTADALARRFSRGVHIEGDRLQSLIVSGAVSPGEAPAEEEGRQIRLNVKNQCLLARSFAEEGFTPVLDYVVVSRARLADYRGQLPGLTLRLVTLAPGVRVALERDRRRPEKTVAAPWAHLGELIKVELAGVGLWLDNASLTVAETVDLILARAEAARV